MAIGEDARLSNALDIRHAVSADEEGAVMYRATTVRIVFAFALTFGFIATERAEAQVFATDTVVFEDAEIFRPTTDAGDFITVYDSVTLDPGRFTVGFYGSYARNPLEIEFLGNERRISGLVENLGTMQLTTTVGVLPRFQLGARIQGYVLDGPLVQEPFLTVEGTHAALGDIVANGKVTILDRDDFGVGLAVLPEVTFPTGDRRHFAGTGSWGFGGRFIVDAAPTDVFRLGVNAGATYRDDRGDEFDPNRLANHYDDQLHLGGSLAVDFSSEMAGILEGYVYGNLDDLFGREIETPIEILPALRFTFDTVDFTIGAGFGLTKGRGAPDYRVFVGLTPSREGIPTRARADLSQSIKSYVIVDIDRNGQASAGDVIEYRLTLVNSGEDAARNVMVEDPVPGRTTYVPDSLTIAGQPMTDSVGDDAGEVSAGIPPVISFRLPILPAAPGENEVEITYQVKADTEITSPVGVRNSAIATSDDTEPQPMETEVTVFPAIVESDRVLVRPDRIELTENIHFEFDKAVILEQSFPILRELAEVLQAYPELRINIVGHTDSVGTDEYNQRLSHRRAKAVRKFLIDNDIPASRLEWEGKGESAPIASNETPTGRAMNRRTEFLVINPEALSNIAIERKQFEGDLAPESEPEWLRRGEAPPQ